MLDFKDFADRLTAAAQEKVENMREELKPDFDELGVSEAKIRKIKHADGSTTKRKVSQSQGEIKTRTGKSKSVLRRQSKKLKKTLKKVSAGKQAMKTRKRNRAISKRAK